MRVKAPALVISFANVTEALAVENACKAAGLPGRIIPVPREITAGCGLAWSAPPEEEAYLAELLAQAGIRPQHLRVLEV